MHSLSLQIQIKYFAIKKQKLICSSYLELSDLRPKAASASRDLESFSMILPDCSHENKLFQKDWVFSHVQNRCNRCSVSFRQKVHFSLSVNPNLCKKLLVDSRRCINSYLLFQGKEKREGKRRALETTRKAGIRIKKQVNFLGVESRGIEPESCVQPRDIWDGDEER